MDTLLEKSIHQWVSFHSGIGLFVESIKKSLPAQIEITVVESTPFMCSVYAVVSPGVNVMCSTVIDFEQFLQNPLITKPIFDGRLSNFDLASSLYFHINVKITGLDIHF